MGNWQLDPYHTQVEFSAKHLGMMTVRGYFDETVFRTLIPRDVHISEAPSHGVSVLDYSPRARGAWAYTELVMEVIERE